jgi:hypothetical protein
VQLQQRKKSFGYTAADFDNTLLQHPISVKASSRTPAWVNLKISPNKLSQPKHQNLDDSP